MSRQVQAAFLCLVLKLSLAEPGFKEAVSYIYDNAQAIRLLFLHPMTFFVAGGTFDEDPLQPPHTGRLFKCGAVKTSPFSGGTFSMKRYMYVKTLPRRWLETTYDMINGTSPGYTFPNYMQAYRHIGNTKKYAGTIYLLLSDTESCALFYHNETSDCELWEREHPKPDRLASSFCNKYLISCNNKTVKYYYNNTDCPNK
uniref:Putative salivary lipocalin n=1 Tax=Ixodes ricinus TaxID=34613 RepID=A0A6B0V236_IXORI